MRAELSQTLGQDAPNLPSWEVEIRLQLGQTVGSMSLEAEPFHDHFTLQWRQIVVQMRVSTDCEEILVDFGGEVDGIGAVFI